MPVFLKITAQTLSSHRDQITMKARSGPGIMTLRLRRLYLRRALAILHLSKLLTQLMNPVLFMR